jgi:hypothetical protein
LMQGNIFGIIINPVSDWMGDITIHTVYCIRI